MTFNHHALSAITAAAVSLLSVGAFVSYHPLAVAQTVGASKHAWPALSNEQKVALSQSLRQIPGLKLDIVCGDGACTDLAQDIDDAAEAAGVESILDHPVTPLGYGIGVKSDVGDGRAQKVAEAISAATAGAIEPITGVDKTFGYAIIFIGKHKD